MSGTSPKTWAMLCHLSSLCVFLGVPFGSILGPLLVWLIKKDEDPLIDAHGRASLNYQISLLIWVVVVTVICLLIALLTLGFGALIFIPLGLVYLIAQIVPVIIATIAADKGQLYEYPLTIRFL